MIAIDDEPSVLEGLRLMVDWGALGLELCGEASDGLEGLKLIESLKPDIVLTDIRMPRLDGLELIKRFADLHTAPKFIIISGYSDFEYARSAIRYGVRNYLLKPLDTKEFADAFSALAVEIEDERLREAETLELSRYIVGYYIGRVIHSAATPRMCDKLTFMLGLLPNVRYRLVCVMVKDFYRIEQTIDVVDFLEQMTKTFGLKQPQAVYYRGLGLFFAVVREDWLGSMDIARASEELAGNLSTSAVVLVSDWGRGIHELERVYQQLQTLRLWYHFGCQCDILIYGVTHEPPGLSANIWLDVPIQKLTQSVLSGSEEETRLLIEQYYQVISLSQCFPRLTYLYQYRLAALAEDLSSFYSVNIKEHLSLFMRGIEDAASRGYKQEAEQIFIRLSRLANNPSSMTHCDLAQSIVEYTRENIKNELSLQVLADVFSLSPLVISKLIRKHCGKKFNDLVNDIKIENAKRLIATSDIKLSDVANEVGYRDNAYFSSKFRQLTGMLPSEYKGLFA